MKKYLPLILLAVGLLVVVGAFVLVRSRKSDSDVEGEEEALLEVPLEGRPVVSLTPTSDGHYFKLAVEKIDINGAVTVDYELLYKTKDNVTQGVPGTVKVEGVEKFDEDLLLGSESSGKFRYDEGVEEGTLTLRFRNSDGKLVTKFETEFRLQTDTDLLTSADTVFKFELDKESNEFFVTMTTVGYPGETSADVESGPYGIFSSSERKIGGTVDLGFDNVYRWDGSKWNKLEDNTSSDLGIFFGSSQ